jgi:PAS domain S-box-containing protein
MVDRDSRWVTAEDELCEVLGRRPEELSGALVDDVLHPDDAASERTRHGQLLRGALRSYRAELRALRGDGEAVWVTVGGQVALGAGGAPEGFLLALQDISARRALEAAGSGWATGEGELDGAGLVAVKDASGRYVRVSAGFQERFRVSEEVLRGRDDGYLFPPATAAALRANDVLALEAAGVMEGRDVLPLADGDHAFVALRFGLAGAAGNPCGGCTVWAEPAARDAAAALADRLLARERQAREAAARTLAELLSAECAGERAVQARAAAFVNRLGRGLRLDTAPRPAASEARGQADGGLADTLRRGLASSTTREQGLARALPILCRELGWEAAACYLPRREALRCCAFWRAPGLDAIGLEMQCRQTRFAVGRDLVGRVSVESRPTWVPDVLAQANPVFRRSGSAAAAGLRSALAFPVPAGGARAGVVELFARDVRPPDTRLLGPLAAAGRVLGQFVAMVEPVTRSPRTRSAGQTTPLA